MGGNPWCSWAIIGPLVTVEAIACTDPPVLTIEPGDKPFPRVASITDVGRQVLSGAVDYLSLAPSEQGRSFWSSKTTASSPGDAGFVS
jgi:hypothetical protein